MTSNLARFTLPALLFLATAAPAAAAPVEVDLHLLGRTPAGGEATAEIGAFDPQTRRAFATNASANSLDAYDFSDPANPTPEFTIDLSPWGAGPNSVAYSERFGGIVAVAIEDATVGVPGSVQVFDAEGARLAGFPAGPLPDMLTFTSDGSYLLVANEGEPADDGSVDPEGSVTVIDLRGGLGDAVVSTAELDGVPLRGPVRTFTPGSTVAEDLEPEYITTSGERAYVSIQEANAVGILDIETAKFEVVRSLGFKDHGLGGNGLDATDAGAVPSIAAHPGVFGMYQPDALAAFTVQVDEPLSEQERQEEIRMLADQLAAEKVPLTVAAVLAYEETAAAVRRAQQRAVRKARRKAQRAGLSKQATKRKVKQARRKARERVIDRVTADATAQAEAEALAEAIATAPTTRPAPRTYVATANEGDARDWSFFSEEERVTGLPGAPNQLDLSFFEPNPTANTSLGRLNVTSTLGDIDGDPQYERVHPFGARSMSLLDADGKVVFDTGDELEQLSLALDPANYNKDNEAGSGIDNRSDNKGPEPEAVDTGLVADRQYAFVAAERSGMIYAYDLTASPGEAEFAGWINTRPDDLGPEGIEFVDAADSPNGQPMLLVTYEITGTVTAYSVGPAS